MSIDFWWQDHEHCLLKLSAQIGPHELQATSEVSTLCSRLMT